MQKNFKQILKEQVILEFHQKGLDDLITFFVAKYPNFTYTDLDVEHLISEYLRVYDIHFLASYIRYSDLSLLGSGMRDLAVILSSLSYWNNISCISQIYLVR